MNEKRSSIKKDIQTDLHWLALNGQYTQMKKLIEAGADVNCRDSEGSTPLHQAAVSGTKEAVHLLLINGAEVNARDKEGFTPLHEATGANIMHHEVHLYLETITELINAGADIFARTNDGTTMLDLTQRHPFPEIKKIIHKNMVKES